MARKLTTSVRLDPEDAAALARARAQRPVGVSLDSPGIARRRRPPSTGLFIATAIKLGDEFELFKGLEE